MAMRTVPSRRSKVRVEIASTMPSQETSRLLEGPWLGFVPLMFPAAKAIAIVAVKRHHSLHAAQNYRCQVKGPSPITTGCQSPHRRRTRRVMDARRCQTEAFAQDVGRQSQATRADEGVETTLGSKVRIFRADAHGVLEYVLHHNARIRRDGACRLSTRSNQGSASSLCAEYR